MDVSSFLIGYPQFEGDGERIYEGTFNQVVYEKKEFHDLKLDADEAISKTPGVLLKHQEFIARFLSEYTPYKSLLIYHVMGSGKTTTAIAAIERVRSQNPMMRKALIIVPGPGIMKNFRNEIVFKATKGQYIPPNYANMTEQQRENNITRMLKDYYDIVTIETFYNTINKLYQDGNVETVKKDYSNRMIVVDEVHHLRVQSGSSAIYDIYHRFLHDVTNVKILLMSGTPMRDRPEEIVDIMNLILPLNNQISSPKDFRKKYINKDGYVREDKKDELKQYFRGLTSYLQVPQIQNVEFEGEQLNVFTISKNSMKGRQADVYIKAFNDERKKEPENLEEIEDTIPGEGEGGSKGEKGSGFYSMSRQAACFVFPDGNYGSRGFSENIKETKRNVHSKEYNSWKPQPHFELDLKNGQLESLSSKYYDAVNAVINNPNQLSFMYSDFVEGSGLIVLGIILETLGYTRVYGSEKDLSPGKRYAIITGRTTDVNDTKNILKLFNQDKNATGGYIQVILGSEVISEGFSLKNVVQVHILTPHWNYAKTAQAVSRALRISSHEELEKLNIDTTVRVWLHCAMFENKNDLSIDAIMYEVSETKDIAIKGIERLIKEASVDCALNKTRNSLATEDYSRQCDYMLCDYECDGITNMNPTTLITDTYDILYSEGDVDDIRTEIFQIFNRNFVLDFNTLKNSIRGSSSNFLILKVLKDIIESSTKITDKYGMDAYLHEDNDLYFLSTSMSSPGYFSEYYTKNLTLTTLDFDQALEILTSSRDIDLLNTMKDSKLSESEFKELFQTLSSSTKESMVEEAIIDPDTDISKYILKEYESQIKEYDGLRVFIIDPKKFRCLQGGIWRNCTDTEKNNIRVYLEDETKAKAAAILERDFPFKGYGMYKVTGKGEKKFAILVPETGDTTTKGGEATDKRKVPSGKVCTTFDKADLIEIAYISGVDIEAQASAMANLTRETLLKKYEATPYKKIDAKSMNDDELRRYNALTNLGKVELCNKIEHHFKITGQIREQ